jgi:hypothetical protein
MSTTEVQVKEQTQKPNFDKDFGAFPAGIN